ncbi:MAG: HAD hydrolase-like protein [Candidatus Thorarchaeota archaeon]
MISAKNNKPIRKEDAHIIFDLHGVLVSKEKLTQLYDNFVINFLVENFNLSVDKTENAVEIANKKWLNYWKEAKELPKTDLVVAYEKANALWAEIIFQGKYKGDFRQMAEFLEYFIPTNFCSMFSEVQKEIINLHELSIPLFIASSAYTRHTLGVLIGCKISNYFNKIIGLENTLALKCSKEYYQKAFSIIGTKPENCIFVGNSQNEIELPKLLGAKVVHITREITDGTANYESLNSADLVLPNLINFSKLLFENNILD